MDERTIAKLVSFHDAIMKTNYDYCIQKQPPILKYIGIIIIILLAVIIIFLFLIYRKNRLVNTNIRQEQKNTPPATTITKSINHPLIMDTPRQYSAQGVFTRGGNNIM